jgi:uncharacterized repeat protein (TIGR04076 family)
MFKEKKIKLIVKSSKCDFYKAGDEIYIDGPVVDTEKTKCPVCLTAINAIYPFIYGARKGLTGKEMGFEELIFQCPDCPETVTFELVTEEK